MKYHSIAISGLPGAGKSGLAKKLSIDLKWKTSSIGEIWRERHKEQNISVPFEDYWKNTGISDNKKINDEFLKLVNRGKIIADTRYAHIYSAETLKVFVTAPVVIRALRAFKSSKYIGKDCESIEQILETREKDEVMMGRKLYGDTYDYRSPEHYDLIIDSGLMNVEEEYKAILNKMQLSIAAT